jgi:hypothetical protein
MMAATELEIADNVFNFLRDFISLPPDLMCVETASLAISALLAQSADALIATTWPDFMPNLVK